MSSKHSRAIAAPFQQPKVVENHINQSQQNNSVERKPRSPKITSRSLSAVVDFRSFTFKPLQPYNELSHQVIGNKYCGPTTESNWVIPGVLLVGAYPATQDDDETFEILASILKLGIKKFVCLQQEYRPGVPEDIWRAGLALRPYFEDVKKLIENKSTISEMRGFPVVDSNNLSFVHCPIVDCDITDDGTVLNLCKHLVEEISRGDVIYLHCWGGHGRTGTVVSIMLHLMYGLSAPEAMRRCQVVHDLRKCPVDVGSPQTQTQRDQVTRIVTQLINSYRTEKKPLTTKKLINDAFSSPAIFAPDGSESAKKAHRGAKFRTSSTTVECNETTTVVATSTKLPKFSDPKQMTVQNLSFQTDGSDLSIKQKIGPVIKSVSQAANQTPKSGLPLASIVKERLGAVVQPILPKGRLQSGEHTFELEHGSGAQHDGKHIATVHVSTENGWKTKTPDKKIILRNSLVSSPHSSKAAELFELQVNGHGVESQQVTSDFGSIVADHAEDSHRGSETIDNSKCRPMSISLDHDEELPTCETSTMSAPKEDEIFTTSQTVESPKKSNTHHHDNSVRNALMVARQVLLGTGGVNATNSAIIVGDTLPADHKKKLVPVPPINAAPAGKASGVATTRKVDKEFHSLL